MTPSDNNNQHSGFRSTPSVVNDAVPVPLSAVPAGTTVRLTRVDSCRQLAARLAAMGIVSGIEMTVLQNSFAGPVIIAVQGSRWMLGRGEANKLLVRPALSAT